ncbi:MAG: riboflavin synthase [Candidatus Marinimicrobia bacterium]|nr:riboflavin synthase [Candidatus Neomarinimicrobiota bacterium]
MFTGIVEELGTVSQIQKTATGKQFTITAKAIMDDLKIGDSVNVNGVCLTVTTHDKNSFNLDLVKETLKKSNLGDLKNESHVNLERAITLSTRLGGHILQGHVETVGVIMDKVSSGDGATLSVGIDPGFMRYCIAKGSIALDGISLTIASMSENIIKIALIPHTLEMTTLGYKDVGDSLNIETDIIGKYIERLMSFEDDDDQMEELLLKGLKNWEFGES